MACRFMESVAALRAGGWGQIVVSDVLFTLDFIDNLPPEAEHTSIRWGQIAVSVSSQTKPTSAI